MGSKEKGIVMGSPMEQVDRDEVVAFMDERQIRAGESREANRYLDLIDQEHRGRWAGEVNPLRQEFSDAGVASREIKDRALNLGAHLVGISRVNQAYVYGGKYVPERFAISLGMEMDYDQVETAPGLGASTEGARVYYELGKVTLRLAEHIRSLGRPAYAHHPLGLGRILQIPFALAAGLGELGKNGLVISREYGPRLRLACVTTDLPLETDGPVDIGVGEFCGRCRACLKACPTGAIAGERQVIRGDLKYAIDSRKCWPYRVATGGCSICIKVCALGSLAHRHSWIRGKDAP
ncbi:MAG: 4Fe-4S double cluster binding domain-containing protein [Dehalococcoidia bacterium]